MSILGMMITNSVEQAFLTPSLTGSNQPYQQPIASRSRRFKTHPEITPFTMELPYETHYHKLVEIKIIRLNK